MECSLVHKGRYGIRHRIKEKRKKEWKGQRKKNYVFKCRCIMVVVWGCITN
jgi:hypothetical protein